MNKLCKDCKHYGSFGGMRNCHHPVNGKDLVDGTSLAPYCSVSRRPYAVCGPDAKLFEQANLLQRIRGIFR